MQGAVFILLADLICYRILGKLDTQPVEESLHENKTRPNTSAVSCTSRKGRNMTCHQLTRALIASLFLTIVVCHTRLIPEAQCEDRPPVTQPRATSGDTAVEPNWDEKLTIRVSSTPSAGAQLIGSDEKVIQAAVDYVARLGGGTVEILPGEYLLRNSVFLASKVRLLGHGAKTVLKKTPSKATKLIVDSDWYDQEITLEDATGLEIGDGVLLRTKNPDDGGNTVLKRTLIARSGNRFKLDKALRNNFWQSGTPTASTLYPLVTGEYIDNCVIENLTLDGNRAHVAHLDGNYGGCIFLQDCNRIVMRHVEARNNNGDGISWQICHDCVVENCFSHDNADLGLHPGSGSQRPIIRGNHVERNHIGIFFCWGVKYGLAEKNKLVENDISVSIGHRDTDNLVIDNEILRSRTVGVVFRPERGKSFAGHRNRIERNRIVDTGSATSAAIDIQGETEHIQLASNEIQETRAAERRVGIRISSGAGPVQLLNNQIQGFAKAVEDLRHP